MKTRNKHINGSGNVQTKRQNGECDFSDFPGMVGATCCVGLSISETEGMQCFIQSHLSNMLYVANNDKNHHVFRGYAGLEIKGE